MLKTIQHVANGKVIWAGEVDSLPEAIERAVAEKTDLSGADLFRADLARAKLSEADLARANLSGAYLFRADLSRAKLSLASLSRADLSGAHLSGAHLSGADLSGAYLTGADLTGADLTGADITGANLTGAILCGAILSGADLSRANLFRAHLTGAILSGADLSRANLFRAHLSGADLSGASLSRANLTGADLTGAYLSRANGIDPRRCTPLLILLEQPGKIRGFKLTNAEGTSPIYNGPKNISYRVGETVEEPESDTNISKDCAAGINLCTLDWAIREWQPGWRIFVCEFTASDIAAIPTATDGKFRVRRCLVVEERDPKQYGLAADLPEIKTP